jgi:cell division protein FtsL
MTVRPLRAAEAIASPLRIVTNRRSRRPQVGMFLIYCALAIAAFFAIIYSRTALDQSAFELNELNSQISVERELRQRLELEVARLVSPTEIVPAAEVMGLVLPDDVFPVAAPGVLIERGVDPLERLASVNDDVSAAP